MTDQPVNLANFREAIDHDKELEEELFAEFVRSSEEQLAILKQHLEDQGDALVWKNAAHAMKSTSGSLGAMGLADICARAQVECDADVAHKAALYDEVEAEYQRVKAFLDKV